MRRPTPPPSAQRQHEFALQPHEAGHYVGPGIEAMPGQVEIVGNLLVKFFQSKLRSDLVEHAPVQDVELDEGLASGAHFLHARLIERAPGISKREPIDRVAKRIQNTFGIACDPIPPIDAGAEHIVDERLDATAFAPGFACANTFVGAKSARVTNAPAVTTAVAPLRRLRRVIFVISPPVLDWRATSCSLVEPKGSLSAEPEFIPKMHPAISAEAVSRDGTGNHFHIIVPVGTSAPLGAQSARSRASRCYFLVVALTGPAALDSLPAGSTAVTV